MGALRAIIAEGCRLFVDDGTFALAIAAWLLVVWLVLPRLGLGPGWAGLVLFAGLAAILIESVARAARR